MAQVVPFDFDDGSFDLETNENLSIAFEQAWRRIDASNGRYTQPAYAAATREVLAKHIIGLAKRGEHDPAELRDSAVQFLASSPYESDAAPRNYRFVARSKRNHIVGPPEAIMFQSDRDAIEHGKQRLDAYDIEIWEGPRIVIRLSNQ